MERVLRLFSFHLVVGLWGFYCVPSAPFNQGGCADLINNKDAKNNSTFTASYQGLVSSASTVRHHVTTPLTGFSHRLLARIFDWTHKHSQQNMLSWQSGYRWLVLPTFQNAGGIRASGITGFVSRGKPVRDPFHIVTPTMQTSIHYIRGHPPQTM